ncbi:hypothetical protein [Roseateles koreensis]|uniref:Uncharacterized protein n=1 Tax=Roseateles koreensis TaxID=2987526 RepID=A0ABT5KS17_9BURK|nr:hypothetical protein [Roseateles koreensis]MDC8785689.1 hypothetical protein [Roseateles koreensis]
MIASPKTFALTLFTAAGLLMGAATAWVAHAKPEAPMRTVQLERVVITAKRVAVEVPAAHAAKEAPTDAVAHLPRVVIESRRSPDSVQMAAARSCEGAEFC